MQLRVKLFLHVFTQTCLNAYSEQHKGVITNHSQGHNISDQWGHRINAASLDMLPLCRQLVCDQTVQLDGPY